jgi:glycosyltransferase involved in cell wall biosynthesis
VSTWCDFLIKGADDIDFVVWTLMMNPFIRQQYEFADNVDQFVGVPLWGVEQPAEYTREIPSGHVFQSARRTRERDIERHFVPMFTRFLDEVSSPTFDPDVFAGILSEMHRYFKDWEYRTTWRSRVVWETFRAKLLTTAGLEVAAARRSSEEQDAEDDQALPKFGDVRESFRFLVRGETNNSDAEEGEDLPTVGEAVEGLRWLYRLLQPLNVHVPETDVTHSAAAAFCAIPCIIAKVDRGTPFLLTEHGVYLREQYLNIERNRFPFNFKRFLIDFVSAIVQTSYHLADQVSPVCAFNTRWELAYGTPPERIRVIYNGVSPEKLRPVQVSRPSAPTVVQVGRIDPLKDQVTLLRVADAVRREIPDVQFLHWGPVSDDEYWEEIRTLHRELGLERTVHFNGFTDKVAEAYASGDISIMTSISEAFPYGVVDSLMCGRPVVSTAVGGVKEALDGTGRTAPARDVDGLARAVVDMLRMPQAELIELSRRARERAVQHFTLDRFIDEYRDSYYGLAEIGRRVVAEPVAAETVPALPEAPVRAPVPPPVVPAEALEAPTEEIPAVVASEPEEISLAELTQLLADPDPFVRLRAVARVRREPGAEAALVSALADPFPQVRREAVRSLVRVGGAAAAQTIASVATSDPAAEVREAAVEALGPLLGEVDRDAGAGA